MTEMIMGTCRATILWLMILVCAGAAQEIVKVEDGLWSTRDIMLAKQVAAPSRLTIKSSENLSGKLTIIVAPIDSIMVAYTKQARTDSRSRAIDYIDLISVELDMRPQGAELELRAPNPAPWSKRAESGIVSAIITVPEDSEVEINATYHDVDATGPLKALRVPSSLGRIEAREINGEVDITTANRRVRLEQISGQVSASTSNAEMTLADIMCDDSQSRLRNEGGDIQIQRLTGDINIRNSYGRIEMTEFTPGSESSVIRNSSGAIVVDIAAMPVGQLVITNRLEDIDITVPQDLSAFLSLSAGDGEITCKGLLYTPELVQDDRLNVMTGTGEVDISASVRGKGNIRVQGAEEN